MLRIRFKTDADDYRPVVWPIKHPYWCTGASGEHYVIVAYVDSLEQLYLYWPEAYGIEYEEVEEYNFTGRFPKPDWFLTEEEEWE